MCEEKWLITLRVRDCGSIEQQFELSLVLTLNSGRHMFEDKSSIHIALYKECMTEGSESPNALESFDWGVAYQWNWQ